MDEHEAQFKFRMAVIIDEIAARRLAELVQMIHFRARSAGQKRRWSKEVGQMKDYGRHSVMEIHGRVYLNGHYMSEMTFDDACNVARYRHSTEPRPPVDVGTPVTAAAWVAAVLLAAVAAYVTRDLP